VTVVASAFEAEVVADVKRAVCARAGASAKLSAMKIFAGAAAGLGVVHH
jgi:hypothetical protein